MGAVVSLKVGELYWMMGIDSAKFDRGLAASNAKVAGTQKRLTELGKATTKAFAGVGLAAAAGLAESVRMSVRFQAEMTKIHTQAGASTKDVASLSKQVLELGKTTQQGPEKLAEGLYHLKSLGMGNAQAMKALKQASDLAAVSGADLEDTTNALGGAWRSGIKGAKSFNQTVATLNATAGAGNMRMQDLVGAMSTGILPAARTFGVSLSSVGSALALMTDEGIPAIDAATRLRMTMSLMGAPSGVAEKALKSIGLTGLKLANAMRGPQGLIGAVQLLKDHLKSSGLTASESAQVISKAFGGGRSSSAIMTMLNNLTVLKQKQDQINNTMGRFGPAVKAQSKTAAAQFALLKSNLDVLGITAGQEVLPALTSMARWLVTNKQAAIDFGLGLAGLAAAFLALHTSIKIVSDVRLLAKGVGTAVAAVRSFTAAATAAAVANRLMAAGMTAAEAAEIADAAALDGVTASTVGLTAAERASAIAGAAMAAVNPFVWAVAGAAAIAGLGVLLIRHGSEVQALTDKYAKQDKATGFNIAGYKKLASQLDSTNRMQGKLGETIRLSEGPLRLAKDGSAAYAVAEAQVSQAQITAAATAKNLVTRLGEIQQEYGITQTQAEKLAVKAHISAQALGATGTRGFQASAALQAYTTGAGKAQVKVDQLRTATSGFSKALDKLNNDVLAGQGDTIAWRQDQQAATQAINESSKGLRGNSQAALAARQAVLSSTEAAASLASHEATVDGNVKGASKVIRDQIRYLKEHAGKSKFAAAEIEILRKALARLKDKHLHINVDGSGKWAVVQGGHRVTQVGPTQFARGGKLPGFGGGDRNLALLEDGEAVVDKHRTRKYAGLLAMMGVPGMATGGIVGSYSGGIRGEGPFVRNDYNATARMIEQATAKAAASALRTAATTGANYGARTGSVAVEQAFARSLFGAHGWGAGQMAPLIALWNRESGWNPYAVNPSSGAAGIPQALGHGHVFNLGDYMAQIIWGENYVAGRYGSPASAWAHETAFGWYEQGSLNVPQTGPAIVHKGEMIFPADVADAIRRRGRGEAYTGNLSGKQLASLFADMKAAVVKQIQAAKQFASSVTSNARSYAGIGGIHGGTMNGKSLPLTSQNLVNGLGSKLANIRRFAAALRKLGNKGLAPALIRQIANMDPDSGLVYAKAILDGPAKYIKQLNRDENQIQGATRNLGRTAANRVFDNGPKAGHGFLSGLRAQEHAIDRLAARVADKKEVNHFSVRVYIGDKEVTKIIDARISRHDRHLNRKIKSGSRT